MIELSPKGKLSHREATFLDIQLPTRRTMGKTDIRTSYLSHCPKKHNDEGQQSVTVSEKWPPMNFGALLYFNK